MISDNDELQAGITMCKTYDVSMKPSSRDEKKMASESVSSEVRTVAVRTEKLHTSAALGVLRFSTDVYGGAAVVQNQEPSRAAVVAIQAQTNAHQAA